MPEIQEDVNEKVLKFMIKIPRLSGEMLIAGLRGLLRQLENQEPVGKQKMYRLLEHGNQMSRVVLTSKDVKNMGEDMKAFDRFARQYGLGYNLVRLGGQPGYQVFFRVRRAEQMKACMEEYTKWKFAKDLTAPSEPRREEQFHEHHERQAPFTGEILEDKAIVVSQTRHSGRSGPIYVDNPIQPIKGSMRSKLDWAVAEAARRNQQKALEGHQVGTHERSQRLLERGSR